MLKLCASWFYKPGPQEYPPLTEEEIANALATENRQVVETLYALTINLYNSEGDRTKALDSKAAALFGFVGAFISAIFVVMGFLGDPKNAKLASVLSGGALYVIVAVLILLGMALLALFLAVVVKKGWKAPGEKDLFEAIHKYDGHVSEDKTNHEKPSHNYKRHLIEHFWKLYKACFLQNEAKAKALFWGQLYVFLGLILLVAVQVKAVLVFHSDMSAPQNPKPTVSTSPAPEATAVPSASAGRPAPLPVSSKGAVMRESNDRPVPLQASSAGKTVRLGEGRPAPLKPSGLGGSIRNDDAKFPVKGK